MLICYNLKHDNTRKDVFIITTPIIDFVRSYAEKNGIRAHMPGHKGRSPYDILSEAYLYDITEISGADSLFDSDSSDGIICRSEKNAAELFGTYKTLYSAGGSTLCIQTMLALALRGEKQPAVIAARNCHRAFINACIMLGAEIIWVYPDYKGSLVSGSINAGMIEKAFAEAESKGLSPKCVYLTSPDYLGRITPIDDIAKTAHSHGAYLAVDNAHGACLSFIKGNDGKLMHPAYHGADMCCDSAHKALPALTGAAYLHLCSEKAEDYPGQAKEYMSLFGSSSPSYLIMESLDLCNRYISEKIEADLEEVTDELNKAKQELSAAWTIEDSEPCRLTIYTLPSGLTGIQTAEALRERGIECEYADFTHAVLMFSPMSGRYDIRRTVSALESIPQPRLYIPAPDTAFVRPERVMSVREAAMMPSETISADDAAGRICAKAYSLCPPGIALIAGGERFDESHIKILKNYSILNVNVVK